MGRSRAIVIGAGISGVMAARRLLDQGWDVIVLEKSRGIGGRMATRRWDQRAFDHGAQYFRISSTVAERVLQPLINAGVIVSWMNDNHPNSQARWVGSDGMSSVVNALAAGLEVRRSARVSHIESCRHEWRVNCDDGNTLTSEVLVMSAPVPQSLQILGLEAANLELRTRSKLERICYALGFTLLAKLPRTCDRLPREGIRPRQRRVTWIADNARKWRNLPEPGSALTIQSSTAFAEAHFDSDRERIASMLMEVAEPLIGQKIEVWQLHRWKYGVVASHCDEPCLYSCIPRPISFCGDAFGMGKVEGALLSGIAAAKRIQKEIGEK